MNQYLEQLPAVKALLAGADHVDVKIVEGEVAMREFITHMLEYQPGWITFLYYVRAVFVRFLGMRQEGIPRPQQKRPEDLPMQAGEPMAFFKVLTAEEDRYWFAGITEAHLTAKLGVVVEPLAHGKRRFHVITIVHYHKWTGPVYFNVIRPFHHLVVGRMAKAGVQ